MSTALCLAVLSLLLASCSRFDAAAVRSQPPTALRTAADHARASEQEGSVEYKYAPERPDAGKEADQAGWAWPAWARRARIAGAYFGPDDTEAEIEAHLDALAAQHVSVILADSPWGQQYAVWVNDGLFRAVKDTFRRVVPRAHARGLRIVLYQTGLELLSNPERDPGHDHPEWAQRSLDGRPVRFDDVTTEQQHWLKRGIWDFWLSPCDAGPEGFPALSRSRVQEMVSTGIDGLWVDEVYLQSSVGGHDDLWPSADACSAAAFHAATGLEMPATPDADDPTFRRWVVWRHSQIRDFLRAEIAAARAVNPGLVFFNENSDLDTGRATYVANDPTVYLGFPDMSTGHEVDTIDDRMDEGGTGMKYAGLDQWLSFRTMIAFARGSDRGKPSWILTYGYEPRDSAQLAGMTLAEGANFYETKGPQMADTAGEGYRTRLFAWISSQEDALYDSQSLAEVGLLYSPRTRDLADGIAGDPYDPVDTVHFKAYRAAANMLYRHHIPFDVVIDTDTETFERYRVLVVPEVQAMSGGTMTALRAFRGTLIAVGGSGLFDEWLNRRPVPALAGTATRHFEIVEHGIEALADTGLLATDAPASIQIGLRGDAAGYTLILVNAAPAPAPGFSVSVRLHPDEHVAGARLSPFGQEESQPQYVIQGDCQTVRVKVPAGIDSVALLRLAANAQMDNR